MNKSGRLAAGAGALILLGMVFAQLSEKPPGTDAAMAREQGWAPADQPQWLVIYEDKRTGCQYYHQRIDQGTAPRTRFDGSHVCIPQPDRLYDPFGKPEAPRQH